VVTNVAGQHVDFLLNKSNPKKKNKQISPLAASAMQIEEEKTPQTY
jgi:hypothetical protein